MNDHDIVAIFGKGAVGMCGSLLAVIMPWQEQLEFWLRTCGALLGVVVALLSVISLAKGLLKK